MAPFVADLSLLFHSQILSFDDVAHTTKDVGSHPQAACITEYKNSLLVATPASVRILDSQHALLYELPFANRGSPLHVRASSSNLLMVTNTGVFYGPCGAGARLEDSSCLSLVGCRVLVCRLTFSGIQQQLCLWLP